MFDEFSNFAQKFHLVLGDCCLQKCNTKNLNIYHMEDVKKVCLFLNSNTYKGKS